MQSPELSAGQVLCLYGSINFPAQGTDIQLGIEIDNNGDINGAIGVLYRALLCLYQRYRLRIAKKQHTEGGDEGQ